MKTKYDYEWDGRVAIRTGILRTGEHAKNPRKISVIKYVDKYSTYSIRSTIDKVECRVHTTGSKLWRLLAYNDDGEEVQKVMKRWWGKLMEDREWRLKKEQMDKEWKKKAKARVYKWAMPVACETTWRRR